MSFGEYYLLAAAVKTGRSAWDSGRNQQEELWAVRLDRQGQLWASVKEEESGGHVVTWRRTLGRRHLLLQEIELSRSE